VAAVQAVKRVNTAAAVVVQVECSLEQQRFLQAVFQ
jgi:hypothetical protein